MVTIDSDYKQWTPKIFKKRKPWLSAFNNFNTWASKSHLFSFWRLTMPYITDSRRWFMIKMIYVTKVRNKMTFSLARCACSPAWSHLTLEVLLSVTEYDLIYEGNNSNKESPGCCSFGSNVKMTRVFWVFWLKSIQSHPIMAEGVNSPLSSYIRGAALQNVVGYCWVSAVTGISSLANDNIPISK